MNKRLLLVLITDYITKVVKSEYNDDISKYNDDISKVLYAKDKVVSDIEFLERNNMFVQSPKEYGIKRLGKYDNRKYQKRR